MKIVYFDVASYEENFFKNNNTQYEYYLEEESLTSIFPLKEEYKNADIISVFTNSRINSEVLSQFENLKLIALRSVGYNHIDLDYCKNKNITVVNSPNYGNITVAEFALALLLNVSRKVCISSSEYKNAKICPKYMMGFELFDKNVGIVGLGAIGKEFTRIMHGLGLNIYAYDLKKDEQMEEKYRVQYVDFDTLLRESDFISIHAPLTKDNYHMFDENSFKKMKKNAILINTGRGELIDSQALYNALISGEILGAGLDVLENEEIISNQNYILGLNRLNDFVLKQTIINTKLFQLDNVIITPHMAYNTYEAIDRILDLTMENINSFVNGKIINAVN